MYDLLETRWQVNEQAVFNTVADEVVILHLSRGTFFGLDPIGARLWGALQGGEAPISIFESVLEKYDVGPEQLANDLHALMTQLVTNELVTPA